MNTMPELVSVVIPTLHRPERVARTVHNVFEQTYQHLEVVVVVDGYDPQTVTALEKIKDPRLRIVALEKNVGPGEARNTGVRAARGQWVALLDDDDEWIPTKIEKQIKIAQQNPDGIFLISSIFFIDMKNQYRELRPHRMPRKDESMAEFFLSSKTGLGTSTYFVQRDTFLLYPFRESHDEDWDWVIHLSQQPGFRLLVIAEPLAIYRIWGQGDARRNWKPRMQWIQALFDHGEISSRAYAMFISKEMLKNRHENQIVLAESISLLWREVRYGKMSLYLWIISLLGIIAPGFFKMASRPAGTLLMALHPNRKTPTNREVLWEWKPCVH